ncbi:sterol desaturase family protein [Sphingomonas folli]|uniref:sterol desaturase family protein n=1 Tax=Sphingomonas folli TaxID=2862497 RepID=UPI0027E55DE5|nr:sterol desaturase family protein [Sphingomonas folli]
MHPRLRLFRRDWMERLTVMPPQLFVALWVVLLALVFYASLGQVGPAAWVGLAAAGLLTWSLFEYVMHRYLFHLELPTVWGHRFVFLMHGNHHEDPNDPWRSIMPPIVSVTWSGAIWAGMALALGGAGTVLFLGFITGYVIYDAVHFACHRLPVRGRLMRTLRRHHLRHHHGREDGNYAITALFWDHVFGTYLSAKKAAGAHPRADA